MLCGGGKQVVCFSGEINRTAAENRREKLPTPKTDKNLPAKWYPLAGRRVLMLEDNFHVGRLEWNVQRPVRLVPGAVGVVQPGGDDFRRRNVIDVGAEAEWRCVQVQVQVMLFVRAVAGKIGKWRIKNGITFVI